MSCVLPSTYDIGDAVKLHGDFTNPDTGEFSDPVGEISVTYKKPDGTETKKVYITDADVIKEGVGQYRHTVIIDQAGQWFYRWSGKDAAQEEQTFYVRKSIVTPA